MGCTVEVGTTLCADEGMMVMFWVGITVVLCIGMTVPFCNDDVVTLCDGKTVELNDSVLMCDVGITVVL